MIFPFSWYRPYPSDRISFLVDLLPYAPHFLFNVDEVQIDKMAANNLFRTLSILFIYTAFFPFLFLYYFIYYILYHKLLLSRVIKHQMNHHIAPRKRT